MRILLVLVLVLGVSLVGCKKKEAPMVDTSGAKGAMENLQKDANKAATDAQKPVGGN